MALRSNKRRLNERTQMKKLTLQLTDTYLLHFTVTDWKDSKTLRIESQWTEARDPDGLQKKFQVTLEKDAINELTTFLEEV